MSAAARAVGRAVTRVAFATRRLAACRSVALSGAAFGAALLGASASLAAADEPLSFGFLEHPPGRLVTIGATRLHLHCRGPEGAGEPTVLFESGLGGNGLEWSPVAEPLAARTRVCSYDRAGYGWSDPGGHDRRAGRLAGELSRLIDAAGVSGPFVIVAHSFGGLVARLVVEERADVVGLVLLDSSHEEQFARLEASGGRPMVPRGRQFVISQNEPPRSLPEDVRRKLAAFNRMRKTYHATHGEMAGFLASTDEVRRARARRGAPYPVPVTVVRRGRDLYAGKRTGAAKTAAWIELQEDLATLGSPGRLVVAEGSGHHVHADAPALVVAEIERLLERVPAAAPVRGAGTDGAPSAADDVESEASGERLDAVAAPDADGVAR